MRESAGVGKGTHPLPQLRNACFLPMCRSTGVSASRGFDESQEKQAMLNGQRTQVKEETGWSRSVVPRVRRPTATGSPATAITTASPPSTTEAKSHSLSVMQELHSLKPKRRAPPFSKLGASFGSAIDAIWGNRLRSLLTTLGIFIGVAAVIAAFTLTQGVNGYIANIIASLGTNTIIVFPGSTQNRGASQGSGTGQSLTLADEQSLVGLPHVALVSPMLVVQAQVIYGNQDWSTTINGTNVDSQIIQNWTVVRGNWFNLQHDQRGAAVAVLGDTVAHNLFDATDTNPVGQKIRIRDQIFTVIGVLEAKGLGQDDVIYVPFNTAHLRLNNVTYINQILAMADSTDNVPKAQQNIIDQLAKNHHLKDPASYDFQLFNFAQILQRAQQQTIVMTLLLVGIAAISLTVGGIGIMNIMLVSVTERTSEIGLRMAVGARRGDIRNQFLVEALVLCLLGAGLGLLLGLLVGWGVTTLFGLPFVITPITIAMPVAVSIATALIFGIYPAIRAARLNPIEALRAVE